MQRGAVPFDALTLLLSCVVPVFMFFMLLSISMLCLEINNFNADSGVFKWPTCAYMMTVGVIRTGYIHVIFNSSVRMYVNGHAHQTT